MASSPYLLGPYFLLGGLSTVPSRPPLQNDMGFGLPLGRVTR